MRRLLALLLFALSFRAPAQQPLFRATTNLQTISAQVTDKKGNLIGGLTSSDFTLLEDGHPQKIAFFGAERQPISLAILLDTSRSMDFGGKLQRARALLGSLIARSRPEDEISLMPFADVAGEFTPVEPLQRDQPLPLTRVGSGGSAVYDAIATGLCRMRAAANLRRALIVLTDGVDESSRLKLDQLAALVEASVPEVFIIGLYDQPEFQLFVQNPKTITIVGLRKIDNPLRAFARLSKESGAQAFFPHSDKELESALHRIYALLETQYTLAYYPQHPDRSRKIEVRLKRRRGFTVSARTRLGPVPTVFQAVDCEVSAHDHPFPWESHVTLGPNHHRIYHDDFSDRHSGWPNFGFDTATANSARYTGRGYQVYRSGKDVTEPLLADPAEIAPAADTAVAAYGPWWTNFHAALQVEEESFRPAASGGLFTNVNEEGYCALILRTDRKEKLGFYAFVKRPWTGSPRFIIPWRPLSSYEQPGKRHLLEVESNRGVVKLHIDGKIVSTVYDNNLHPGLVGFGVFDDGSVLIHDLRVESLP